MRVAGLMSGTSVDGVDVAVVDITKQKVHLLAFDVFPYPAALRREIFVYAAPNQPDWTIYATTISSWAKFLPMQSSDFVIKAAFL